MLTPLSVLKEIGQSVLAVTPTVFLVSVGFQYLFFYLWKRKWPELTLSWLPNLIFFIVLIFIAAIWGYTGMMDFGSVLIIFGLSYLTVFFSLLRLWLFFDHSYVFTWASIVSLFLFMFPAFPMVTGQTEGSPLTEYVLFWWVSPAVLGGFASAPPGVLTALVFLILLLEAGVRTGFGASSGRIFLRIENIAATIRLLSEMIGIGLLVFGLFFFLTPVSGGYGPGGFAEAFQLILAFVLGLPGLVLLLLDWLAHSRHRVWALLGTALSLVLAVMLIGGVLAWNVATDFDLAPLVILQGLIIGIGFLSLGIAGLIRQHLLFLQNSA